MYQAEVLEYLLVFYPLLGLEPGPEQLFQELALLLESHIDGINKLARYWISDSFFDFSSLKKWVPAKHRIGSNLCILILFFPTSGPD